MDLMEKATHLKDIARAKRVDSKLDRMDSKLDSLDRDNDRLQAENRVLRSELERTRDVRAGVNDAIDEATKSSRPRKHRVRRLLALSAAAGGAYVLGAKAGRERYEQIKSWWRDNVTRADMNELPERGLDAAKEAGERVSQAAQRAGGKLGSKGDDPAV
jgi:hypothetical protein